MLIDNHEMGTHGEGSASDPRRGWHDLRSVLRTRRWTIAGVVVLVLAVTVVLSFAKTPVYESEAAVLVRLPPGSSIDQPNMATEKQVAGSSAVAQLVIQRLHLTISPQELLEGLTINVPVESEIIDFKYSDPLPAEAQRRAQVFAEAYLDFRQQQQTTGLTATTASIESRINQLTDSLKKVERQASAESNQGRLVILQAEGSSLISQISALQQKLAGLLAAPASVGQVVQPAILPTDPARPRPALNIVLGLLAGLALGVGAALVLEYTDDRVHGRSELEERSGVPVLGTIPRIRRLPGSRLQKSALVTLTQPESSAAHAYRLLRAKLLSLSRADIRSILVTSYDDDIAQSVLLANLGVVLAKAGKLVILVSADLRRPRLGALFDLDDDHGLSDLLMHDATLLTALHEGPVDGLFVLPSGPSHPNPSDLLDPSAITVLFRDLNELADIVLVDTPPMLSAADAADLVHICDGVLVVVDELRATRTSIEEVRAQLVALDAKVLGTVLVNTRVAAPSGSRFSGFASRRSRKTTRRLESRRKPAAPAEAAEQHDRETTDGLVSGPADRRSAGA